MEMLQFHSEPSEYYSDLLNLNLTHPSIKSSTESHPFACTIEATHVAPKMSYNNFIFKSILEDTIYIQAA